ncbi:MAG: hypothetical protein ACKPKO_05685, partial [Candidatus Fonsibacter sp.]
KLLFHHVDQDTYKHLWCLHHSDQNTCENQLSLQHYGQNTYAQVLFCIILIRKPADTDAGRILPTRKLAQTYRF